ncbi:hypothetical protein CH254_19760 [Rhodococcus sp. 06-412-2C]|uniref:helix-turn-helix domain-containing protein n=1 Tax=unclassified Rhodococcus (in: high G+C Gram-positive bacteria) TaxID=192944 RepID=UPI000B9ADEF9|nr:MULTISPECIES: helix-turn-helix domain-containing protein [unclassified Rhodococcus (in: high G+C Gram-positive bacteria)]OZC84656.1 hypothetical protein CH254_19760 [Rhodococcus sp. 06-412-2C]OZC98309.1 hypothetical protein CH279_12405 [Rhodococcus sp. 06-412-2B]
MSTETHTARLVRAAAMQVLTLHLDELTDLAVERTLGDEPGYTGGPVSKDDLRHHMDRTLRLALTRLVGSPVPEALAGAAFDVGSLRARQRVPLPTVLHSFRIDLRMLWGALVTEGRLLSPMERLDFLELSSVMVWETVEASTEEVVRGYQVAQEGMEELRSAAFDQLLIEGAQNELTVDNASQLLGLPVVGSYLCIVGSFPVPRPDLIAECTDRLHTAGLAHHFGWYGHELRAIVHLPDDRPDVTSLLTALSGHICAVVDANGLTRVPRAIRLARTAVDGRGDPGVRHVRDTWLQVIAAGNSEISDAVYQAAFGPLNTLTDYERTAILETVGDLVAHGGTIADIAGRTYRHRNTVRRRLKDFTELTGLDLARTADLATTALAFSVWRNQNSVRTQHDTVPRTDS